MKVCFWWSFISVRGSRPGKTVQMTEAEVRGLCLKSRELFLQQPILLELEAPLKICGEMISVLHKKLHNSLLLFLCKNAWSQSPSLMFILF